MTRSVLTDADNCGAKAKQEVTCWVKVPMEALMSGTSSRTARVSWATKNLKEAAGKLPARGTRIAYEALSRRTRGRIDSKSDDIRIAAAYMRRVCGRKVTRLTLRDLSSCPWANHVVRRGDGATEVSRSHSSRSASSACPTYSPTKGGTV